MSADNLYEINLVSSGKLKLRATALLAEETDEATFEACVLYHEAARFERRAINALVHCSPIVRLAASIEECWCLVEGRDPDAAGNVWGRVLGEAEEVERKTAESLLSRLRPRYDQTIRRFVSMIQGCPILRQQGRLGPGRLVPSNAPEREAMRAELRRVLQEYPGAPSLWGLLASIEDATGNQRESWNALQRAVRLAPDNPQFQALSLIAAAEALPRHEADAHLLRIRPTLYKASAEVCAMYAFAELLLARRGTARKERWRRALEAVNLAFPQMRSEGLRKNLNALQLYLRAMLDDKRADRNLLYRAGLGGLAATRGGDLVDLLQEDALARVAAMDVSGVAA